MATTQDRSAKALLRGRSGTLLDWELDPEEPPVPNDRDHRLLYLPKCVYVKFEDDVDGDKVAPGWSIAGMDNGVYCLAPKPEYWYLDTNSKRKHMKIRRYQLPIAPDFARTAYACKASHYLQEQLT